MSAYQLNKVLYMADNDPSFLRILKEAPEIALEPFRLTETEYSALLEGKVAKLREMGAHTFLLNHLQRYELFGVNRDNYLPRIREGMPYDPRFEQGRMPIQRFIPPEQGPA
jgi:hypothetical protein